MQCCIAITVIGCVMAQAQHENSTLDTREISMQERLRNSSAGEPRLGVVTNSYYDFLINEGSYKFWAVFQNEVSSDDVTAYKHIDGFESYISYIQHLKLVTVAILLYSTFAAIYYAKYTFLKEVENSDVDDFLIRSSRSLRAHPMVRLDAATFLRIIDSISQNPR